MPTQRIYTFFSLSSKFFFVHLPSTFSADKTKYRVFIGRIKVASPVLTGWSARTIAQNNTGGILKEPGNFPEEKGGGKDGKDDAAGARLIARRDGQHPCSLFVAGFPLLRGIRSSSRVRAYSCVGN